MAQFDAKKFAEMQKETGAAGGSGKKENKKEKKEKPAQQPKQEKKKKEATPADEEDEPLVVVPKQKDPMEGVPKGNFLKFTNLAISFTYIYQVLKTCFSTVGQKKVKKVQAKKTREIK